MAHPNEMEVTMSQKAGWGLLACGALAGPLFIAVVLVQAVTRDGYNLSEHPLSLLTLGDLGWIQSANFVAAGALVAAFAVGLRRALRGRGARSTPLLIAFFGLGLVVAGVFTPDPSLGFPARGRRMRRHGCLAADVCGSSHVGMYRDALSKIRRSEHGRSAREPGSGHFLIAKEPVRVV
jgi:hypothetical protein